MSEEAGTATEQEVAELKALQGSFDSDQSVEESRTFAKWVFGVTTTLAALGTVFGKLKFAELEEAGQVTLLAANSLLAIALFFAVLAMAPRPPQIRRSGGWTYPGRWDSTELREALNNRVRGVRAMAICAGWLLAGAFLVAGIGPLASWTATKRAAAAPGRPAVEFSYTIQGATLSASATVENLEPGDSVLLRTALEPEAERPSARAWIVANADGEAKLSVAVSKLPLGTEAITLQLLRSTDGGEEETLGRHRIQVAEEEAEPAPAESKK